MLKRIQNFTYKLFIQDEDKKSGAGDGQTTEDESSQDSKGESAEPEAQGSTDVDVERAGQSLTLSVTTSSLTGAFGSCTEFYLEISNGIIC